jgi:aminopeptidase N
MEPSASTRSDLRGTAGSASPLARGGPGHRRLHHATRPIEYPVGPPKEAEGMFDLLTYEKGCAVLRMLEQHIGAEVFRDGVRTYLRGHAYANTVTTDLWDALEVRAANPCAT